MDPEASRPRQLRRGLFTALLSPMVILGCDASQPDFDERQRQIVASAVRERLAQYATAITERDLDGILSFWSDSLVFAGDGAILGGLDEWASIAQRDNEETARWLHWTWDNVHILPLSPDAASATLEFEYEKVSVRGDTVRGYGSWTYVLTRGQNGWQVRHGNGHHPER